MSADRYLTVSQVCRLLRVSESGIYGLAQAGRLPGAVKVGRVWRFHEGELLGWLAAQRARQVAATTRVIPRASAATSELTDEERRFFGLDASRDTGLTARPRMGGTKEVARR